MIVAARAGRRRTRPPEDVAPLGVVHVRMGRRIVAKPTREKNHAQTTPRLPKITNAHRQPMYGDWMKEAATARCRRPADLGAGADERLRGATFPRRKPAGDHPRRVRQRPASPAPNRKRITNSRAKPLTERGSAPHVHGELPDAAGQGRERRPPQHDADQHPPRTKAIAPVAGCRLEDGVGDLERHADQAPLEVAQAQLGLHGGARLPDADAIDVQDEGQRAEIPHHAIAHMCRSLAK